MRSTAPTERAALASPAMAPTTAGTAGITGVTVRSWDSLPVVSVNGLLRDLAEPAYQALSIALAEGQGGVVCDLSGARAAPLGGEDDDALARLASLGEEAHAWPATPVGVLCPSDVLRTRFAEHPHSAHLAVAQRWSHLRLRLGPTSPVARTESWLARGANSGALLRQVVRTLEAWGCGRATRDATLVVEAMLASAMAALAEVAPSAAPRRGVAERGAGVEVAYDRRAARLRMSVRYDSASGGLLVRRSCAGSWGMLVVGLLSRSWGVCRTHNGGTVLWAVIAVPDPPRAGVSQRLDAPLRHLRAVPEITPVD